MLELLSAGHVYPYDLFPGHEKPNQRQAFDYWEVGALLDGLAHCPSPAVSGLDEALFTIEMHEQADRHARYKQSRLALTELGKALVAHADDFSRHNPSLVGRHRADQRPIVALGSLVPRLGRSLM
ncbi:hypothetical protein [Bradyrhizobium cenepequi]|uniref:hypothetical protein n=1 Tax=Bradyrhizobium cenepequi TaxID=2821403 RepID=UPI001CE3541C|nr:hypothetical protein [Bradyrhizobium cenepequi]MCA6110315.1 hypothetical protein [Bradyrhizobium cenepequi]